MYLVSFLRNLVDANMSCLPNSVPSVFLIVTVDTFFFTLESCILFYLSVYPALVFCSVSICAQNKIINDELRAEKIGQNYANRPKLDGDSVFQQNLRLKKLGEITAF